MNPDSEVDMPFPSETSELFCSPSPFPSLCRAQGRWEPLRGVTSPQPLSQWEREEGEGKGLAPLLPETSRPSGTRQVPCLWNGSTGGVGLGEGLGRGGSTSEFR